MIENNQKIRERTIFKGKNIVFLELEKYFIELKDRKLKDREANIKQAIDLFFKPIILSIDEMDRFEQKQMKKIRPIKNTCYDWLINYILQPIRRQAVFKCRWF